MSLDSEVLLDRARSNPDLIKPGRVRSGPQGQVTHGPVCLGKARLERILGKRPAGPARTEGVSRFTRAWLALLALLLGLGVCRSAHAQLDPVCPSPSLTITTSTPSTIYVTGASGQIYAGTLQIDTGPCQMPAFNASGNRAYAILAPAWFNFAGVAPSPIQTPVTGLFIMSDGAAPTGQVTQDTAGTCTLKFQSTSGVPLQNVILNNNSSTAKPTCRAVAKFTFVLTKSAGAVNGQLPLNQVRTTSTPIYGFTNWGTVRTTGAIYVGTSGWSPTITTVACTVSTPNVTVILPTVAKTALASAGATAGLKPFTLSLTGCSGAGSVSYAATATWSFTPGPSSTVVANSAAAPAASNVYVQLLDSNLSPIANGTTTTLANIGAGSSYSTTFYARYYASGAAGAGGVAGVATFTMTYQ